MGILHRRRAPSAEWRAFEEAEREASRLPAPDALYIEWPREVTAGWIGIPPQPVPGVSYAPSWCTGSLTDEPLGDNRWPPRIIWRVGSTTGLRPQGGTLASGRTYLADAFAVVEPVPAWASFGPFGDSVLEHLLALDALAVADARRLAGWLGAHPPQITADDRAAWTFPSAQVPVLTRRSELLTRCSVLVEEILLAKAAGDPALEAGKHDVVDPEGDWDALHECATRSVWAAAAPDLLGPGVVALYSDPWQKALEAAGARDALAGWPKP
jgi:hypothetical protein